MIIKAIMKIFCLQKNRISFYYKSSIRFIVSSVIWFFSPMVRCILTFFLIRNQATEPQPLANSLLLSKSVWLWNRMDKNSPSKSKESFPQLRLLIWWDVGCWFFVADSNSRTFWLIQLVAQFITELLYHIFWIYSYQEVIIVLAVFFSI